MFGRKSNKEHGFRSLHLTGSQTLHFQLIARLHGSAHAYRSFQHDFGCIKIVFSEVITETSVFSGVKIVFRQKKEMVKILLLFLG